MARPTAAGQRILLVDDEVAIRECLQGLLQDEGYQVVTAANGRQALAQLAVDPPDVVLSDVMMPVLDGWGLWQAMQAEPAYHAIPVVLMSAARPSPERLAGGAVAFLPKPVAFETLLQTVAAVLAPRAAR
jgi:CheY-like chemotaxis protein